MLKAAPLSKYVWLVLLLTAISLVRPAHAQETADLKPGQTGSYQDVFDQSVYYEGTNFLRFDRLYRAIFRQTVRAQNVNDFDELADDSFFTNRQGRQPLTAAELEKGVEPAGGPDTGSNWTVLHGEFLSAKPASLLIRDGRGDPYELNFDTFDQPELATSSEVIASRFYHAIGYHVPPYSIVTFAPERLVPAADATVVDRSGFRKQLTQEKLKELMLFLPMNDKAEYRVSARRILTGTVKGNFRFQGRAKEDPSDTVDHENRRDIRALVVFAAWLNHYAVNESNTLDLWVDDNGKPILKHYLINFNTALGSDTEGAKPPMYSYEYLFDYGETLKAFLSFGIWEKPWQARWREAKERINPAATTGYFDNRRFNPERFKPEFPYYAFKNLTAADGFWAAKIIASFSNDDIAAMVRAGKLSNPDDAKYLTDILINRRDIIAKYWFRKSSPFDNFKLSGHALSFDDLAVKYGFENAESTAYHLDILKNGKTIHSVDAKTPAFDLSSGLTDGNRAVLRVTASRNNARTDRDVWIELTEKGISKIAHQD